MVTQITHWAWSWHDCFVILFFNKLDFEIEMNSDRLKNEMPIGKTQSSGQTFWFFHGDYELSSLYGVNISPIQISNARLKDLVWDEPWWDTSDCTVYKSICIKFNSCYTSPYYNCQWFISYMFSSMSCRLVYERFNKI